MLSGNMSLPEPMVTKIYLTSYHVASLGRNELINPLHTEFIWENIFSFSMIINSEMVKVKEIVSGGRLFTS